MSDRMTTVSKGFRVEDITFKNARRQEEILNEIDNSDEQQGSTIEVPVSLTPEQVKTFFKAKINIAKDSNEKRVYSQAIVWIDEMLEARKKIIKLEAKDMEEESYDNEISSDI